MISILGHESVYLKTIIISYYNIENLRIINYYVENVPRVTLFDKQSIIYSLLIIDKSTTTKSDLLLADNQT